MNGFKTKSGVDSSRQKKKSGAGNARQKKSKLLEAAGSATNQMRLSDCFKKIADITLDNSESILNNGESLILIDE